MVDAPGVLLDDRSLVELGRHVVAGGADQLHAPLEGLVVGAGAGERRQERVVDVDDAPGAGGAEGRGEDLHVSSEDDHVGPLVLEHAVDLLEGGLLGAPARARPARSGSRRRATRPARAGPRGSRSRTGCRTRARRRASGRGGRRRSGPPGWRRARPACARRCRSGATPCRTPLATGSNAAASSDGPNPAGRLSATISIRRKKRPVSQVAVLGGLEDRPAVAGDQPRDGGDDADAVGAGDGQDVAAHPVRCRAAVATRAGRRRGRAGPGPAECIVEADTEADIGPSPGPTAHLAKSRCTRRSGVSSGWNDDAEHRAPGAPARGRRPAWPAPRPPRPPTPPAAPG